jgi:hypothetical protein
MDGTKERRRENRREERKEKRTDGRREELYRSKLIEEGCPIKN